MKPICLLFFAALLALTPVTAFASAFDDKNELARTYVDNLSQEQLDAIAGSHFRDAHRAALMIGFDRAEIDQLKRDVQALRQENANLRAQLNAAPANTALAAPASLEARVSKLEHMFAGLQNSLVHLLNIVSEALTVLRS